MEEEKLAELQKKLDECEKEKDAYLDGWRRCKADYINYQKDELKRLEEMAKFGSEDLIWELLVIFDSFAAFKKNSRDSAQEGINMIQSQLENILKKRGLNKIEILLGQKFDPAFHEAVEETESDQPAGTIAEETDAGWTLHNKVIRAAKVKIAKVKKTIN